MELIKTLGTKPNKNNILISWALFKCPDCLQEVIKQLGHGKSAKSCGSAKCKKNKTNYKHGGFGTRLYKIWTGIKDRCLNSNRNNFPNYGGRGITICNEWLEFIPFRDWALSNGYAEGLQIHRENDGNYEPDSCRWVTLKENCRHRRGQKIKNMEMANEIRDLHKTGNYTQRELAEKYSISRQAISDITNNRTWK